MNNAQGKHYGKSLLFIAATFLVLCVWLLREYSLPKLYSRSSQTHSTSGRVSDLSWMGPEGFF